MANDVENRMVLNSPDALWNAKDDNGYRVCVSCGESYKTKLDELWKCHEHFFEMDRELQEAELDYLVGERNALREENRKLMKENEEIRSRCRYREAELRDLRAGLDGLLALFPKVEDTEGGESGQ